jgi:hypothetical protein
LCQPGAGVEQVFDLLFLEAGKVALEVGAYFFGVVVQLAVEVTVGSVLPVGLAVLGVDPLHGRIQVA